MEGCWSVLEQERRTFRTVTERLWGGGEFGSSGASRESQEVRRALSGLWANGKVGGPVRARETPWFEMS